MTRRIRWQVRSRQEPASKKEKKGEKVHENESCRLSALLFALCFPAEAQQAKIPRIGWLGAVSASFPGRRFFVQGLRELGYVVGKSIIIEYRYAAGKAKRLPDLAAELVRNKVEIIGS